MPRILQINVVAGTGSHGRIVAQLNSRAASLEWEGYIAYGRGDVSEENGRAFRIGNDIDKYLHAAQTRLFDRHGLGSVKATGELVRKIREIRPDIIHLHNIHGYYLNYEVLFNYLNSTDIPVVWTLHDCWAFTGHCAQVAYTKCDKWLDGCCHCPEKRMYPESWFADRSEQNYELKKRLFTANKNLTVVTVSDWLKDLVGQSFLKVHPVERIYNGINLSVFRNHADWGVNVRHQYGIGERKLVLGVANVWNERKGLNDFTTLRHILGSEYVIMLVGLTEGQKNILPSGIIGVGPTHSLHELASYYSAADVYVNPSWEESLSVTNIEAIACGTPVASYSSGGTPETLDKKTGIIVSQKNIGALAEAVKILCNRSDRAVFAGNCRNRAEKVFNSTRMCDEYFALYNKILSRK